MEASLEGGVIGRESLRELVKGGLVSGYVDLETQLQPNGFDFSLDAVFSIEGEARLDFDNSKRVLPVGKDIVPDGDGWFVLPKGIYRVRYAEIVSLPIDVCALGRPRSSLVRGGASLETAVWDAGYSGRSESLLVVHNPAGLRLSRRARIMQLVFFRTSGAGKGYDGVFKNENVGDRKPMASTRGKTTEETTEEKTNKETR